MKRVMQTKLRDVGGNCFRACLASVLEIEMGDIPPFEEKMNGGGWYSDFLSWVEARDMGLAEWSVTKPGFKIEPPRGIYVLARGESPRGEGEHYVVWKDGGVAHDPHPSGEGLVGTPTNFKYLY